VKKVERSCVVCRKKDEKSNLIRMVKTTMGIKIDVKQIEEGRGFYVCKSEECVNRLMKHKKFTITQEMAEEILKNIRSTPK